MDLDKEINIQITTKCSLKCNFCARSWVSEKELKSIEKLPVMDTEFFKKVVDECIKAGKTIFGLTPRMGDLFTDPDIISKLNYLENHPDVEYYFFATNLINVNEEILKKLLSYKKLYLEISLYGYDNESFYETTGKRLFHKFKKNLDLLSTIMDRSKFTFVKFFVRWGYEDSSNYLKSILLKLEIINKCEVCFDEINNFNFGGLIPEGVLRNEHPINKKEGVCPTAYTGCILPNGDYNLCYMNDVFNELTLDNIFITPLSEILNSDKRKYTLNNMKKGIYDGICTKCNENW